MRYKSSALEMEFLAGLHPLVKAHLIALDEWSVSQGIPEVVITHVLRTKEDMEIMYWKRIHRQANPAISESLARAMARRKFSWHLVGCAADIRNRHYLPAQRKQVMYYLRKLTGGPNPSKYELLEHDIGRGDHIHLGVKDEQWKKERMP